MNCECVLDITHVPGTNAGNNAAIPIKYLHKTHRSSVSQTTASRERHKHEAEPPQASAQLARNQVEAKTNLEK